MLYGVGKVTIAFTTAKPAHMQKLMGWTKQELGRLDSHEYAPAFVFTSVAPPLEPKSLWLEPCWYTASSSEPTALLIG
jgi:hypothetical protein